MTRNEKSCRNLEKLISQASPLYSLSMRVAVISKADSLGGGAGAVAQSLAEYLPVFSNVTTQHISLWRKVKTENSAKLFFGKGRITKTVRLVERITGYIDVVPIELPKLLYELNRFKPDVVHFHDLSSAISPLTVSAISHLYPTCWTLHDMSPITAGCLYVGTCQQWKKGCGQCPQIGTWPLSTKKDKTKLLRKMRHSVLEKESINLITPSEWLKTLTLKQLINSKHVSKIDNGVRNISLSEIDIYKVRASLQLNPQTFTIILVAGDLDDERKGFVQACNILKKLYESKCVFQLILVGNYSLETVAELPPVDVFLSGYIEDHNQKMILLTAADIFLFLSKQDNQPLTVLEALVQGTRVVGYPTGGVVEIEEVKKYKIGEEDLIASEILAMSELNWSKESRTKLADASVGIYGIKNFVKRHTDYYQSLLNNE